MEKEASRRTEAVSIYNNIGKELILLLQTEFEFVDHRAGKIVVELNGRLNKCGVISLRFDIGVKDIEGWTARLLPSGQNIFMNRLVSGDEQCQRFLVALMINYHHDDIMTYLSLSPGIFARFSIAAALCWWRDLR
nr:40S ribosomal protein S15a-1 [Ipomoea batatas]